jgi:hypothetical protein
MKNFTVFITLDRNSCHRIAALVFLASTLSTVYVFQTLNFTNILSLTEGLFTGAITAGIWLAESSEQQILQSNTT